MCVQVMPMLLVWETTASVPPKPPVKFKALRCTFPHLF